MEYHAQIAVRETVSACCAQQSARGHDSTRGPVGPGNTPDALRARARARRRANKHTHTHLRSQAGLYLDLQNAATALFPPGPLVPVVLCLHPPLSLLPPSLHLRHARSSTHHWRVCSLRLQKKTAKQTAVNAFQPQKIPAIYVTALDPVLSWGILGSAGSTVRCPNPTLVNQPVDCTAQSWLERS